MTTGQVNELVPTADGTVTTTASWNSVIALANWTTVTATDSWTKDSTWASTPAADDTWFQWSSLRADTKLGTITIKLCRISAYSYLVILDNSRVIRFVKIECSI